MQIEGRKTYRTDLLCITCKEQDPEREGHKDALFKWNPTESSEYQFSHQTRKNPVIYMFTPNVFLRKLWYRDSLNFRKWRKSF